MTLSTRVMRTTPIPSVLHTRRWRYAHLIIQSRRIIHSITHSHTLSHTHSLTLTLTLTLGGGRRCEAAVGDGLVPPGDAQCLAPEHSGLSHTLSLSLSLNTDTHTHALTHSFTHSLTHSAPFLVSSGNRRINGVGRRSRTSPGCKRSPALWRLHVKLTRVTDYS